MVEIEAIAIVIGVEVFAGVERDVERGARLPPRQRRDRREEIGAAAQGFGGDPVTELRSARRRAGLRLRSGDAERWLFGEVGDGSTHENVVCGIVFPHLDGVGRPFCAGVL